jgi:hypothetical protein
MLLTGMFDKLGGIPFAKGDCATPLLSSNGRAKCASPVGAGASRADLLRPFVPTTTPITTFPREKFRSHVVADTPDM